LLKLASKITLITAVISISVNASAIDEVIYGSDDRVELSEAHEVYQQFAAATAAMVRNDRIKKVTWMPYYKIKGQSLEKKHRLCEGERFGEDLAVAACTGFLVGEDTLVTAGHCITVEEDCEGYSWVFDFKKKDSRIRKIMTNNSKDYVGEKNVYRCKKIIKTVYDPMVTKMDFAVIKLDRPVKDREPLQIRREGSIEDDAELFTIGHPMGVHTKVASNGTVRENDNDVYFVTNLDTFKGNSGGPVINAKTGLVEGIVVRGEADKEKLDKKSCFNIKRCEEDDCRGEDVTRISQVDVLYE